METRRGFFRKIGTAVAGAWAVTAGIAMLPTKPTMAVLESTSKGIKDWVGYTEVGKPITYEDLEAAYNSAMKGGEPEPYRIYMSMDDYRRGIGLEGR